MRNHVLDAEKAVAAYMVVFLHLHFPGVTGEIFNAAARFAVPFFFMISGYFCWRKDGKAGERLPGKIRHTFFLCVTSFGFYIVWQWIWHVIEGKSPVLWFLGIFEKENIRNFLYYNNTTAVKWHLWFLPALLYCYVLFWAAEKLHAQKLAEFLIPVLLLGHFMMEEASALTGKEYRVMEFRNYLYTGFPFFMAGFWIHKHQEIFKKYLKGRAIYLGISSGAFYDGRGFCINREGIQSNGISQLLIYRLSFFYGRLLDTQTSGNFKKTSERQSHIFGNYHGARSLNRRIFPFGADGAFYRFRYSDLQSVFLRNYKRRRKSAVISFGNRHQIFLFYLSFSSGSIRRSRESGSFGWS